MEALPGIAAVLRSPVANAMVALSRSAAGLEEFQFAHAEELLRFGVRRNLLTPEEVDKVLDELREVVSKRPPSRLRRWPRRQLSPSPTLPRCPTGPRGSSSSRSRSIRRRPAWPPAKPKPAPPPKPCQEGGDVPERLPPPRRAVQDGARASQSPRPAAKKAGHQKPSHHKPAHRKR